MLLLFIPLLGGCSDLFFFPQRELLLSPAEIGLSFQELRIEDHAEPALHGWYLPAATRRCATLLFLHGNAENISTHLGSVYWLPANGVEVYLFDYRGYGRSEGEADLGGAFADVQRMADFVAARSAPPRVIFGQSLGAALAIRVAAEPEIKHGYARLIAESPFASYRDIAREKGTPWSIMRPLAWLLTRTIRDDLSPQLAVPGVSPMPITLIHGDADTVVPIHHSKRLFSAALQPKELWVVEGAEHLQPARSPDIRRRMLERICPLGSDD